MLQKNDRWCCAGENAWCVFLTQNPCGSPDKVVSSSLFILSYKHLCWLFSFTSSPQQQQPTTIRFSLPTTASFAFEGPFISHLRSFRSAIYFLDISSWI
jgi:hypothetical protein